MLYIIMKDKKHNNNNIASYRIGIFHTKVGATRVARRLGRSKPNNVRYRVVPEQWYLNRCISEKIKKWKDKRAFNKYNKLLRKRNKLNDRITGMKRQGVDVREKR